MRHIYYICTMKETWKQIPDFEMMYEVSNYGNVRGFERNKIGSLSGKEVTLKSRLLKPYKGGKGCGYLRVCLSKNNKKTIRAVHRLVAELFIPNPDNKKAVNHIDGNKWNNMAYNLEWCTNSENMVHYYQLRRKKANKNNQSIALEII